MAESDSKYDLISRKEAKARGLRFYFTGKACKRGHITLRRVSGICCCECQKLATKIARLKNIEHTRLVGRLWYAANPERNRQKHKKHYAKYKEKIKRVRREWYAKNAEYAKNAAKEYRAKNIAVLAPKARVAAARYRAENPERAKEAIQRWWDKNPGRKKVYHRNRKARKRGNGGSHTSEDIADIFKAQRGCCAYCREALDKVNKHVDHIVPLIRGGTNDRKNLQILCEPCNLAKAARDPIVHAQSLGLLL